MAESEYIADGTIDFTGGQDGYHIPDRIPENSYAKGINVSVRRGVPHPRDGWEKLNINFADTTFAVDECCGERTIENLFRTGKFQAFIPYYVQPRYYFLIVIGGLVYSLNVETKTVNLLSSTVLLNQYSARVNWSLAGKYIVLFDYPNFPVIVNGLNVFRANPNNVINGVLQPQVPISTIGAFNQNRLFVANAGNEFTGGDPVGNPLTPEAPITFTEVLSPVAAYPGQAFSLGTNNTQEPITAMGFLQSIDQNTGLGPLFVATQNSMYYFRTDTPRADWENESFGSLLLFNAGVAGPRAICNVNSDLLFLSGSGQVYALSTARDNAKEWGNAPISREVADFLKYWDPALKQYAFLNYFDNRAYVSANPYRVQALTREGVPITDYTNGGVVVMEYDNTATMRDQSPPIWSGLWTGIRPMDMAVSNNRCFAIAKTAGKNELYVLTPEHTYDFADGEIKYVKSILYTREYFAESRFVTKYEQSITMPVQDVQGDLSLKIERRPSHSNLFKLWKEWFYSAPFSQCEGVNYPNGLTGHRFRELIFGAPDPDKDCDPANELQYAAFRKLQLKLTLKARYWSIEEIKVNSQAAPSDDFNTACDQERIVEIPADCSDDWDNEQESLCNPPQM